MQNITKTFPGVVANDQVNFALQPGEIHALLGENGAGKTTLMNILYGIYRPDGGQIFLRGRPIRINSPRQAIKNGIGMVHQHFKLIPPHTVAENIALGLAGVHFLFPLGEVEQRVRELSERYGLPVDPKAKIWQLSAGEQQRVEIIKALIRGAEILILDEPTSVLTPGETKELFAVLRRMAAEGQSVIFITHKLDEVMEVADRVTVLRKGKVVGTLHTMETEVRSLAQMMVGREVLFQLSRSASSPQLKSKEALVVENLWAQSDRGMVALQGISLTLWQGEILGIAGVAGNGQRELVEVLTGLRQATKGKFFILGSEMTNASAKEIAEAGVAHIPEERLKFGLVPGMSVAENLVLKSYRYPPIARGLFLNLAAISRRALEAIERYGIVTPSARTPAKLLSGGNIQRLILAREFSRKPKIVIAAHPTAGLDVGATEQIRNLLLKQKEQGAAILLVSEDLDEIMNLSDRIAVMFRGKIMGIVEATEANLEEIGLMMAGVAQRITA